MAWTRKLGIIGIDIDSPSFFFPSLRRHAVADLLRMSPNESNKCLESIVAALLCDMTRNEVFFGAFDYIN